MQLVSGQIRHNVARHGAICGTTNKRHRDCVALRIHNCPNKPDQPKRHQKPFFPHVHSPYTAHSLRAAAQFYPSYARIACRKFGAIPLRNEMMA
jgi:hypothetical protein